MQRWPHQVRATGRVLSAIQRGGARLCLCIPTGGGKSLVVCDCITALVAQGWRAVVYTNRKLLVEQLSRVLDAAGISHAVRAAGYAFDEDATVAISSLPTEQKRTLGEKARWKPHGGDDKVFAVVDEAHLNATPTAKDLLDYHVSRGGAYLGVTATPIDVGWMYDTLIQEGTKKELRECGALVWAHVYAPDEPDLKALKKKPAEGVDLSPAQQREAMGFNDKRRDVLFGRIWEHFERLNPDHKPTICFGPDVAGSQWIAEQFTAKGVRFAHLDGSTVWIDGDTYPTTQELRDELLAESKAGTLVGLCNRFVLREGVDAPWLAHGILATVFGSFQTCEQSYGRLLRAYPGLEAVTFQDHGGNYWRHGSPNADRAYRLDDTGSRVVALRAERMRAKKEQEPFACPQCKRVWVAGLVCSQEWGGCGYELDPKKKSRAVITVAGTLKEVSGNVFKPRRLTQRTDAAAVWERMYWRARSRRTVTKVVDGVPTEVEVGWSATFRQAEARFAEENNWGWPPRDLPLMPVSELDWFEKVQDVPYDRLIPKPEPTAHAS